MKDIHISNELKANYDDYYEGESAWRWLCALDKADNITARCNSYPHATILDIGSGEGSVLKRLSDLRFGDSLCSLEISESAVETIGRRKIRSLVKCRLFDGYNIPYEDKTFDLVLLCHVLEHLEYPRKLLSEARRVGRYVFLEVPLEDNIRLKKDFAFDKVGHINVYSPKTIRRLVQSCDLEILSQVVTNPSRRTYEYRLGRKGIMAFLIKEATLRIMPSMATALWGYHCSLICRTRSD